MEYNWATKIMKKLIIIIMAFAFMPFASMGSDNSMSDKSRSLTEEVKSNKGTSDWTPIGTTEIAKKIRGTVVSTQTVQVYSNSDGTRAIKDGSRYCEIEENSIYGKFPSDECVECGYRYRVLYRGEYWYTHGVVKQSYGSY